jgi:uncharacterized protein (TIGR03437 family)
MRPLFALLCGLLPVLAQPRFDLSVAWISPGPAASRIVYAYANGSLFRTTDAGETWVAVAIRDPGTTQPELSGLLVTTSSPNVIYALGRTRDGAVWKSADGGTSWRSVNVGLPNSADLLQDAFMDATDPNMIYLRTGSEVYKTTNGGENWARISTLSPAGPYLALVGSPSNRRTIYYANSGSVFQSTNEGATWTAVYAAPGSRLLQAVAVDRLNSDFVLTHFAGTAGGPDDFLSEIVRSTDAGIHWDPVTPAGELKRLIITSGNIYYGLGTNGALVRTANAANTWTRSAAAFATALAVDPVDPAIVYAGANGVSRSTNFGATFTPLTGTVRPHFRRPNPISFRMRAGDTASILIPVNTVENEPWAVSFQASASEPWLRLTPSTGTTPAMATLTVDAGNLAPGTYSAQVRLESPQSAAPLSIPVTVSVDTAGASGPQFRLSGFSSGVEAPAAVSVDPAGNVFASTAAAVFRIDANATPSRLTVLSGISGLLAGSDGVLYLARPTSALVQRIVNNSVNTLFTESDAREAGARGPFAPQRIRFDSAGRLLIAAGGSILRFSTASNPPIAQLAVAPEGSVFADVASDPAGNLYIVDSARHAVHLWEAATSRLTVHAGRPGTAGFAGDGGAASEALLNSPRAIQRAADGTLYVVDAGNHVVRAIAPDARIFTLAGGGSERLNAPSDVALDALGNLLVSDAGNNRIARLEALRNLPEISRGGLVNAAGNRPFLSPGSLFTVYGSNLSMHLATAEGTPWPTRLGDSSVFINGRQAPLFYVSGSQINGQVPYELEPGPASAIVASGSLNSSPATAPVLAAAPGILLYGEDRAVAVNASGRLNGPGEGAAGGSVVTVYVTGIGTLDNPVSTGAAAPNDTISRATLNHRATLGGRECEVLFLGLAPGFVGLGQANIRVPSGLSPSDHTLVLTVNGVDSNPARIAVF